MSEITNIELEFPADDREKRHLARAFEMLESEKMDARLGKHGIRREAATALTFERGGRFRVWQMATAAALVLALAAVLFIGRGGGGDPLQLADAQLVSVASDYNPTVRSTPAASHLDLAKANFSRSNWQAADGELDAAIAETAAGETATLEQIYFYKGLIQLELDNFSAAADWFSKTLATGAGNFERDARWLRGLAFLKTGDVAAARADFEKTAAVSGWKKSAAAQEILKVLEKEN